MTAEIPAAARTLLRQLDGWSVSEPALWTAPATFKVLSATPRGDGTRERIDVVEVCDNVLIRARHVDGRAFMAFWLSRPSRTTKKGAHSWSLDVAIRGRHAGEYTPHLVGETALMAYVSAPDVAAALAAVGGPVTLDVLRARLGELEPNEVAA